MAKKRSSDSLRIRNSTSEFLTFAYQKGGDGVEVRVQAGTIWLSQKLMGELFATSTDNIGLHLKNIFKEGELDAVAVTEEFSATASDGKTYRVKHYNLDTIIAVEGPLQRGIYTTSSNCSAQYKTGSFAATSIHSRP